MSTTPASTDNSAPPLERRLHARQPAGALAYLEIGADNGGIVLNLSEGGVAFCAAGPLDSQAGVTLRIQLPHSQTRIETEAQIVWVGESHRQAGACFVHTPPGARAAIRKWVCSQFSPLLALENTLGQREIVSEARRKQESVRESRKDKWLSLMAKQETAEPTHEHPPPITGTPRKNLPPPAPQEAAATIAASGSAPVLGKGAELRDETGPGAVPLPDVPRQPRTERVKLGLDAELNRQDGRSPNITVPGGPDTGSPGRPDGPKPVSFRVASIATSAPIAARTVLTVSPVTERSRARRWLAVAMLSASVSVLFFGIGIWVASLGTRDPSARNPGGSAAPVIVSSRSESASTGHKLSNVAPAAASKNRAQDAAVNLRSEKWKLPLPLPLPPISQVGPEVPSTSATEALTVVRAAAAPETSVVPAAIIPSDPASLPAATRTIAGRTLRPTDRFNPCHLTYRVEPGYPLEARQQRIEGGVKIRLDIGADGTVHGEKLISGLPQLAAAAIDAAKYWRYLPALVNGQPVESEQEIEIDFRAPN